MKRGSGFSARPALGVPTTAGPQAAEQGRGLVAVVDGQEGRAVEHSESALALRIPGAARELARPVPLAGVRTQDCPVFSVRLRHAGRAMERRENQDDLFSDDANGDDGIVQINERCRLQRRDGLSVV